MIGDKSKKLFTSYTEALSKVLIAADHPVMSTPDWQPWLFKAGVTPK